MEPITVQAQPSALAKTTQVSGDEKLIEMWLGKKKSDRTVGHYLAAFQRFDHWLSQKGRHGLQSVTAVDMLDYQNSLPKHWSDATRNQHIAAIKSLWSFGLMLGYFPFNVGGILSLVVPNPVLPERILTRDEVMDAIDAEPNENAAVLLCLLFGTGVRCAEALALTWNDITEMDGFPRVTVRKGKGDKTRVVSCFRSCWDVLIQFRGNRQDPLFDVSRRTAFQWVKDAFVRTGKPDVSPHWLRHASAIAMRQAGMDWPDIANQLGHSNPAITLKAYSHLTDSNHTIFDAL